MAQVVVTPEDFVLLDFSSVRIAELASEVALLAGFSELDHITIRVNETTPLQQVRMVSHEPVVLDVESGAFDDPHMPRVLGDGAVRTSLALPLFRAFDRRQPGFSDAPAESLLTHEARSAWEVYAAGRMARSGLPSPRQRRLYGFRVRHGFTDVADLVFGRLWEGQSRKQSGEHSTESLSWADIEQACDETAAARN
jgi:hypothetical protein